jgi:large subunit ribosomal protein L5
MLKGSKEYYLKTVVSKLMEDFKFRSIMEVPRLEKIVMNMGLGEAKNNKNILLEGVKALTLIAGQKAVSTLAKKSIAGFKIRDKMPIGAMVTLRGKRMYSFLTKFINVSLPRIKDFHGIKRKGFDSRGSFTLGIKDFKIFPETSNMHSSLLKGMSIVLVSSVNDDYKMEKLLEYLGFPFVKNIKKKI